MITVFVNKNGYYVAGEGIEAALKCSPATDLLGKPIFQELHHLYKVMFLALREVSRQEKIAGDVIVYNDSRIIDELSGGVPPLDEVCKRWQQTIRREIIPYIRSVVFFRKKTAEYIKSQLKHGEPLFTAYDQKALAELIQKQDVIKRETTRARALNRFKGMWKNGH